MKKILGSLIIALMLIGVTLSHPLPSFANDFSQANTDSVVISSGADTNAEVMLVDAGNKKSYSTPSSKSSSKSSSSKSSSNKSSSSSSGGLSIFSLFSSIPFLILIVIAYFVLKKLGILKGVNFKDGKIVPEFDTDKIQEMTGQTLSTSTGLDKSKAIEDAIKENDPLFTADKFLGFSKEVYLKIQEAWTARDWSKIRPFEKEELFNQHAQQLEEYKRNGTINIVERINVNKAFLQAYKKDAEYEYLTVQMNVRLTDYIIDEGTRQVVRGDRDSEDWMNYLLTFVRKIGVQTNPATSNMNTKACPHCGAPANITSAGECEYCGYVITTGEHDWVLSNLDSIED